jgi:histidinol-phosphate phosphatase family protein
MKIVFLDRDGVINKDPGDNDYVKSWQEFEFLPQAQTALKKLCDSGFKIFIISNQAGVGKGIYTQENLDLITKNMLNELNSSGVNIEAVYYCTHKPQDNCACRKPKTGLIDAAIKRLDQEHFARNKNNYFFIGDTINDVETGKQAGLKTILVFSGKEKPENKGSWQTLPDFTASNLSEAVDLLLHKK